MLLLLLALDVLRIITYHTLSVCACVCVCVCVANHEGSGKGWNGF